MKAVSFKGVLKQQTNLVIYAKTSPKMVNPRDIAGETDEDKEEEDKGEFRCMEI